MIRNKCKLSTIVTIDHKKPDETLYVALNPKNQTIGFAITSTEKSDKDYIWLKELEVSEDCRRKGVGKTLLNEVVQSGKKNNVDLIYAVPMTPADLPDKGIADEKIHHFYDKNGFKPCNAPKGAVTEIVDPQGNTDTTKKGVCLII